MEENKTQLPASVTPEAVAEFKKKYGDDKISLVHITTGVRGDKSISVIIRSPDRVVIGEFEKWVGQNPLKAREILVGNCLLTDKEKMTDDDLFHAVANAISDRFPKSQSTSVLL